MTIGELLADTDFTQKTILQKLIMYYCQLSREDMWLQSDTPIGDSVLEQIRDGYTKYITKKMPLEYIVGKVTFLGYDFVVNQHTLIPRPETEYMIEAINEHVTTVQSTKGKVQNDFLLLDVGTGCGVLGLSVLLHNPDAFSGAILSDFSPDALGVAKTNYRLLVESGRLQAASEGIKFVHSSLLDYLTKSLELRDQSLDDFSQFLVGKDIVLVANLPYIPDAMFDENVDETVKKWEPRMAFVGGDDGLDLYRKMFDQLLAISSWLLASGEDEKQTKLVMFLEMMTWQVDILRQEFGDKMEFVEVKTFHFNIRIVKAILS